LLYTALHAIPHTHYVVDCLIAKAYILPFCEII